VGTRDEEQVKKALKIDSWRNLSKDKLLDFVAEMPKLDKDVAMRIIAQFPEFKSLVSDGFSQLEKQVKTAHRFNWKSQKRVHEAFKEYRALLNRELDRENLTPEDRWRILDLFNEAVKAEAEKDSENKALIVKILVGAVTVIVALVGLAITFVGGKIGIRGGGGAA
jgi:hypothetical protein